MCYQETGNIDFNNSLTAKTYCSHHNCSLIGVHPKTGRGLTWATDYLWRDAQDWGISINHSPSESEVRLNQQLESLVSQPIQIEQYTLNLAEYCDLLEFFGHYHKVAFEDASHINKRDVLACALHYSRAYEYLISWPTSFYKLLRHFELNPMSNKRQTGIRKCFRDLYDEIFHPENASSNAYALLAKAFKNYIRDHFTNGVVTYPTVRMDKQISGNSSVICEKQLAEILECHPARVDLYVREGLISVFTKLKNGKKLYRRTDALQLKARLSSCMTLTECADHLGVSSYLTRHLARNRII